jgi:gliding motility-associated-like protein
MRRISTFVLFAVTMLTTGFYGQIFAQSNPGLNTLTDCGVFAPTAFTPNRDQTNDLFRVVVSEYCEVQDYHVFVYDRFGRLVFESIDPAKGWDGRYDGKDAKDGVYLWHLMGHYVVPSGEKTLAIDRKGSVVLLR